MLLIALQVHADKKSTAGKLICIYLLSISGLFPILPALLPPWPLLQLIAPCLLLIVFVFSLPSLATLRAITFQALVFIIILLNFFLGTDIEMDACN